MRHFLLRLIHLPSHQLSLLVLVLSALPLLHWCAAILLALVTLRQGIKTGCLLALAMTISALLLVVLHQGQWLVAVNQVVAVWLLWGSAGLVRATHSWVLLLQLLTVLGLAVVVMVHWVNPDIAHAWLAFVKTQAASLQGSPMMVSYHLNDNPALLDQLTHFATGIEVMTVSAVLLVTLMVARWLQALLYNPGGLKQELYFIHLQPVFASVLLAVMIAAVFSQQYVLMDCLGVVLLPLLVSGLSLMHYLTARVVWQGLWLVFCYGLLVLFSPQVLMILIGAGFVDAWWNIRQRHLFKR